MENQSDKRAGATKSEWVRLVVIFFSTSFIEGLFASHIGAFLPLRLLEFGLSRDRAAAFLGVLTAIAGVAGLPLVPFWGALADRYKREPIIVRSYSINLIAALVMMKAGGLWMLVLGRSLTSLCVGNTGLELATLAERVPPQRVGLSFGIMTAALPLGAMLGPPIGGPIFDAYGWFGILVVDSLLLAFANLVLVFGYVDAYVSRQRKSVFSLAAESIRTIVGTPELGLLFIAMMFLFSGWLTAYSYMPLIVAGWHYGPRTGSITGMVLGAGGLGTILIAPSLGMLADRFGRLRLCFVAGGILSLMFIIPTVIANHLLFVAFWAVLSGMVAGVYSDSLAILSDTSPEHLRGRIMSYSTLPSMGGLILGPSLAGLLASTRGPMVVFPLGAALTAIGVVLMGFASKLAPNLGRVSQDLAAKEMTLTQEESASGGN